MRVLKAAIEATETGVPAALVVVIGTGGSTPRAPGSRMLVTLDGLVGTIGGGSIEHQVVLAAREAIQTRSPRLFSAHLTRDLGMCCGGEMSVWIEPLEHRPRLTIYGAGHVAHALAPIAEAMEYAVTVVDPREDLNTEARFPTAARVQDDPVQHADALEAGFALIVTHDHALDQELVQALLPNEGLTWVGMIGSRVKVTRFLVRLKAADTPVEQLQRLCAPVGLDIGAQTPAEIAVAIAGELVRVRRNHRRPPLPLSELDLPIREGPARPTGWSAAETDLG